MPSFLLLAADIPPLLALSQPNFMLLAADVLLLVALSQRLRSHEMSYFDVLVFCIIYGLGAVVAEAIKLRLSLPEWAGLIIGVIIATIGCGKAAAAVFGVAFKTAAQIGALFLALHFGIEYLLRVIFPAVV